jgi:hypothetical protein
VPPSRTASFPYPATLRCVFCRAVAPRQPAVNPSSAVSLRVALCGFATCSVGGSHPPGFRQHARESWVNPCSRTRVGPSPARS